MENKNELSEHIGELIAEDKGGTYELFIDTESVKIWRDAAREKYLCLDGRGTGEPALREVEYVISVVKEKWDKWDFSSEDEDFITDAIAFAEISAEHEIDGVKYMAWFEIVDDEDVREDE